MLFGLDYVLAGYVELVANKQLKCVPLKAPQITVTASSTDIVTDHTKTIADLTAPIPGSKRGKSPYGQTTNVFTEGLMLGSVKMPGQFGYRQQSFNNGQGCIHIDTINVRIEINPTIFIAKEYKEGTCYYNAVMEHERKHVAVERFIVNKYIQVVGDALKKNIDARGYVFGPLPTQQLGAAQQDLSNFLTAVIDPYAAKMSAEREKLQSDVDTLKEYERVHRLCPDKFK